MAERITEIGNLSSERLILLGLLEKSRSLNTKVSEVKDRSNSPLKKSVE
jgi:hypothetical protein